MLPEDEKEKLNELRARLEREITETPGGEERLERIHEALDEVEESIDPRLLAMKGKTIFDSFKGDPRHFMAVLDFLLTTSDAHATYIGECGRLMKEEWIGEDMVFGVILQMVLHLTNVGVPQEDIIEMTARATISTSSFHDDFKRAGIDPGEL